MKYPFKRATLGFFALLLFLTACKTDTPGSTPDDSAANPAKLSAAVSKNYTVSLNWNAVNGSARLERKIKDGEYISLGDVTDKTSFEDFPVLDNVAYTYRLTGDTGTSETMLSVPAVTPNPLTVPLTLETSTAVTKSIGPEGGVITATGEDGAVYTLEVPAGALLSTIDVTLTPVSSMDVPLSGGLLGAVQITPEMQLYDYATLTITPTKAVLVGMKRVVFGSTNTGEEFYLYGQIKTPTSVFQPQQDDTDLPLELLFPPRRVDVFTTYGDAAATPSDVITHIQTHPPTDTASQGVQGGSTASAARGQRVANNLNNQGATPGVFREYRQWLESLRQQGLEAQFDAEIKRVSKQMANEISSRFDQLFQKCERDPGVAGEMQSLVSWASKYPALVQNLGQAWFSEASDRAKLCQPGRWEGEATYKTVTGFGEGDTTVTATGITWRYEGQEDNLLVYRATVDQLSVTQTPVGCNVATYTNLKVDTDRASNLLKIDVSSMPARYTLFLRGSATLEISCEDQKTTMPTQFLIASSEVPGSTPYLSNNTEIKDSVSIPVDGTNAGLNLEYSFTKIVE
jgi:hypothetical protein